MRHGSSSQPSRPSRPSWEFGEGERIAPGRTVLKSLGGGSRYEVFLVWDETLFSVIVAKVLRPDQADDRRALRALRREAEMLERLSHPVLVRGFGAVLEQPHPHVLLEYLEGPNLRQSIKRDGPLPLEQVLPVALGTAAAIHYLSTEQVVHLDVKPSNIVMGTPPRLLDLSLARTLDAAARVRGPVGTDAYMPPEQCGTEEWRGRIGPASDVWGLGATLYHALCGHPPFPRERGARHSEDKETRFPQLVEEPQPLPSRLPAPLGELILSTLTQEPEERPTAAEFATALEPLAGELDRGRPSRWRRRRRAS